MAEARDPLTPGGEPRTNPEGMTPDEAGYAERPGGAPAATGSYSARDKDPRDIERDIDHTRAEMSETLDAIGARFQPDYIKEQAKDAIRSTARDAGTTMLDTIKENPVPAIIAGLSIGWLVAKGGDSDRDRHYRARYDEDYYRRYGRYPEYRTGYSTRAGYETYRTGYAGEFAGDEEHSLKERVGDAAGEAKRKVGHLADEATDQLHEFADDARMYGRRAESWLERQMNQSPLTMGAVALAAGALVGLAVPETRKEDEWLGRQSDRFKEQAKDVAEEKLEQAKRVAEATVEEAKEQHLTEPPQAMRAGGSGTSKARPNTGSTGGSGRS